MLGVAVLALAGVLAGSPVKSQTAASGDVRATITYPAPVTHRAVPVRLVVVRAGTRVHDSRVPPHSAVVDGYPIAVDRGGKAIRVRDLDGDGEPEILLDFYAGGAHCCWWTRVYRWEAATRRYRTFSHYWGNQTYRLTDLDRDRRAEIVTRDDRFAYVFASFAGSGFPLRIWTYRAGRLIDTTGTYPALVAKDAARHWRGYRRNRAHCCVRGYLAAWAADQCLLGRCREAFARLRGLSQTFSGRIDRQYFGSAASYLHELRSHLRRTGYLR